jgi:3-isopropylmalate dehydrogenase
MAQATHGSAPDIAGRGIANPYAIIVSAAMLLDWLGQRRGDAPAIRGARRMERAAHHVIGRNIARTPDIAGTATTEEFGRAVAAAIGSMA